MTGIVNSTGARSGIIGTTVAPAVGTSTDGYVFTATGAGVNPAWEAAAAGSVAGTCSFMARVASDPGWVAISADAVLVFDNDSTGESHDTDTCYDTGTYEFTAPAAGVYLFWYSLYTANADVSNSFRFKKNDVSGGFDINVGGANNLTIAYSEAGDHIQTGTIVLTLASSDCVSVSAASASDIYTAHSSWGGCRLK